jgi:hypothetical protein
MPIDTHPKHKRSPEEVIAEQKVDAARAKTRVVAAKPALNVPTVTPPDTRTEVEKYADEIAPSAVVGQLIKFNGKIGKFVIAESEEEVDPNTDFVALVDEMVISWTKFNGEGVSPSRISGLLYKDFVLPPRSTLGDDDPNEWPEGLDGEPSDPWRHEQLVPLQEPKTQAFFTFVTSSPTGRNGVGRLLKHFNRMLRTDPGSYPVVRLKPSGYESKKFGWVPTPSFQICGRTPKNSAALPDTSVAADLNDSLPF